ncbi:cation:proton antiporter [Rhizosaccharibacter radicis]|uniref:cation:proton antiporter n=1 Tax=Rhizosaccharibacter radicis TaxID=2782605 RepID=UPI003BF5A75D
MTVTGLPAVLLAIAGLLVVVSAVQPVARRLALPETVLLAISGILIGGLADFVLRSRFNLFNGAARTLLDFPLDSEAFLMIFLPILVFQGGLAIDVRRLVHEAATVLLLAVVAVVLTTAAIGFALFPFAGMPLVVCLLLGAIVATTDPSAVAGIFREIGAASRLTRLVEGEALLNDAAAISLFGLLLPALTSHHAISIGGAFVEFVVSFAGAVVVGVVLARLALLMMTVLGGVPASEITLTIALPYLAYILCDRLLGFSGVVATAVAGLTISVYGPSTMRPQSWRFMNELWEQFVFWAGSLVFVLASMLVPHLLVGISRWEIVLTAIAVVAAGAARAAVVFGLLPILAATKLSPPVPTPFKVTMVWGGLRGAITLALALAVTENERIPLSTAHFIGVLATGFVLVTLLVNGTSLRFLVVRLGLDQLSPIDQALRHQVMSIGLGEVRDRSRKVAAELGFPAHAIRHVVEGLDVRIREENAANTFDTALGNRQRVNLALITIANQERSILLDLFRIRGISRRVMEMLLRSAEAMIDGARLEGRFGYARAVRRRLSPSWRFRIAQWVHHRLRLDAPLMYCMMERFEMLLIAHLVSLSLTRFVRRRVDPTLGSRMTEIVSEVLDRQQKLLQDAIETMRLHYQGYTEALESRMLRQVSLRLEGEEYDELLNESLISEELHSELYRDVETRRHRLDRRLRFNLKSGIETRIQAMPALQGVSTAALHDLAMTLAIHFTAPGERVLRRERAVRTVYFVSAGLFETHVEEHDIHYGPGEVLGADELLSTGKMAHSIRSLRFGHLLALSARDFRRLVEDHPVIRRNIERLRRARLGLPEEVLLLPAPEPEADPDQQDGSERPRLDEAAE